MEVIEIDSDSSDDSVQIIENPKASSRYVRFCVISAYCDCSYSVEMLQNLGQLASRRSALGPLMIHLPRLPSTKPHIGM